MNKTLKCPQCNEKITIKGNPGEKIIMTCPNCNSKGKYVFSKKIMEKKINDNSNAIEVYNLSKSFNGFKAVDNISFTVKRGEIFGFLGPNGAGKTTTIKILTTLLRPKHGTATICGYDIKKNSLDVKKRIGYMPDVPGFYGEMKAEEVLHFYAEFYKIPKDKRNQKINDLLEMMELTRFKKKRIKTFSRGMKQKLGFASSLINDPDILILDEPTIGLDPATIHFFRNSIKTLNKKGVTIFLSSHILSEVQTLCNKVGIIHQGKIVAVDTIKELSKMMMKGSKTVTITFENITEKALKAVKNIKGVLSIKKDDKNKKLEIEVEDSIVQVFCLSMVL
jgi:ABC-2 type transport system ATP-binding protein